MLNSGSSFICVPCSGMFSDSEHPPENMLDMTVGVYGGSIGPIRESIAESSLSVK